jgi:hypothetical protein
MNKRMTVGDLCRKPGMSRQNYYKARRQRQVNETDGGLTGQPVPAERAVQPRGLGAENYTAGWGRNRPKRGRR